VPRTRRGGSREGYFFAFFFDFFTFFFATFLAFFFATFGMRSDSSVEMSGTATHAPPKTPTI
jgi:uncharacterized membrane protein YjjP (DUF1212 family)